MTIINERFYSGIESQKILGIKSRQNLVKYIEDKTLLALTTEGKEGKRYMIRGDWLAEFKSRYDRGLVPTGAKNAQIVKSILKEVMDYCEKNNIKTLEEYINNVKKLK